MKDLRVTYNKKTLEDIAFTTDPSTGKVTFLTVENEQKLVQQLVKLFLTPVETHLLGYGTDHSLVNEYSIIDALKFYNDTTETDNPRELIDSFVVREISPYEFEIVLTTKAATQISVKVGV
jgi:hypothetical protein